MEGASGNVRELGWLWLSSLHITTKINETFSSFSQVSIKSPLTNVSYKKTANRYHVYETDVSEKDIVLSPLHYRKLIIFLFLHNYDKCI